MQNISAARTGWPDADQRERDDQPGDRATAAAPGVLDDRERRGCE